MKPFSLVDTFIFGENIIVEKDIQNFSVSVLTLISLFVLLCGAFYFTYNEALPSGKTRCSCR